MSEERPYIKLYMDWVPELLKLSPSQRKVLLALSLYLDEDNHVDISTHKRQLLLQILNMSKTLFANSLVELQHAGAINKLGHAYYCIDPMYLTKGD